MFPKTIRGWVRFFWLAIGFCPVHKSPLSVDWFPNSEAYCFKCTGVGDTYWYACEKCLDKEEKMKYGHGDVTLKKVDIELKGAIAEKPNKGRWEIALGETHGHCHTISESEAVVYNKDGKRYVLTRNGFTITHEEHKPITVPPGIYEIGIVREFDYFLGESRSVKD